MLSSGRFNLQQVTGGVYPGSDITASIQGEVPANGKVGEFDRSLANIAQIEELGLLTRISHLEDESAVSQATRPGYQLIPHVNKSHPGLFLL